MIFVVVMLAMSPIIILMLVSKFSKHKNADLLPVEPGKGDRFKEQMLDEQRRQTEYLAKIAQQTHPRNPWDLTKK